MAGSEAGLGVEGVLGHVLGAEMGFVGFGEGGFGGCWGASFFLEGLGMFGEGGAAEGGEAVLFGLFGGGFFFGGS